MSITNLAPELRQEIVDRFRDRKGRIRCARCEQVVHKGGFEIDHIRPEIETGPAARLDPANLQVLCSVGPRSCHKRKTAREAKLHAKRARAQARDWRTAVTAASLAIVTGGTAATSYLDLPISPNTWLAGCTATAGLALCTFLVDNAFSHRRPLGSIPAKPISVSAPQETLGATRLMAAAREIIGPRGQVLVSAPTMNEFTVRYPETGFADHDDEKRLDLLDKIQAKIGDRWLPTWDTMNDQVTFRRRPALPKLIRHPGFEPGRPWHVLPIGTGVSFDLLVTSHLLIVGATNAGKTALMRGLIAAASDSASRKEVELILADPKQIELLGFETWPGVREIVTDTEDLWDMAFMIEEEMNRRFRLMRDERVPLSSHPRWIVVIDEYEQYFKRMFRHWTTARDDEGKPIKKSGQRVPGAIDAIQSVLSMARRCGIHLIIGTQSPDAAWFGGTGTRENMGGRAAVGPVDAIRSKMMFDDSSWGRDIPADLKGRATVQVGDGQPVETQCFWVPDPLDSEHDLTDEDWDHLELLGMPKRVRLTK